jgi:hypothetical protein
MKKMKAPAQVKLPGTKICINGHKLETNSFDLEFWSKIKFGTLFNPFVFFSHPILGFIPYFSQIGSCHTLFQQLYNNFIVKQAKCNILGISTGGTQSVSNGKYSNMACQSNFE